MIDYNWNWSICMLDVFIEQPTAKHCSTFNPQKLTPTMISDKYKRIIGVKRVNETPAPLLHKFNYY